MNVESSSDHLLRKLSSYWDLWILIVDFGILSTVWDIVEVFSEDLNKVLGVFLVENQQLKGLLHPKMKISSLITHPHVVPNP